MKKIMILLLLVFSTSIFSFEVQTLDKLNEITNLDSNSKSTWYYSRTIVDVEQETNDILNNKSTTNWKAVKIPGSVYKKGDKKLPASLYLKALFTFSEIENSDKLAWTHWFRKDIIFPKIPLHHVSIKVGSISDKDKVYFNGHLIGQTGDFNKPDIPMGYDKVRIYEVPTALIRKNKVNSVLVHTRDYFLKESGITKNSTAIGPSHTFEEKYYGTEYYKIILFIIYLTAGAYFLFLYSKRPQEKDYLYYALFTLTLVVYQLLRSGLRYDFGFDFQLLKKLEYMTLTLIFPFVGNFVRTFFKKKRSIAINILDGIFITHFLLFTIHPSIRVYNYVIANFLNFAFLAYMIYLIVVLTKQLIAKNKDAYRLVIGTIVMVTTAILDLLTNLNILNIPRLMSYGFLFFVVGIAAVLAARFVRISNEIEELNINLENKVKERTEELQTTLNDVRELKVQQDGDYFLTSLLIKPLGVNRANKYNCQVDFLINQKKKFKFKKWESEIGGDLCIAHSITLMGKEYVVFVNGDAMGKSMQGAGGALVLGVLFNSLIARTQISSKAQNRYPEQWLRDCILELQTVFVTFDGMMLISVMLGMIDEETGLAYYVNAEHPFTVLYRDNKAIYMDEDLTIRKIGIPDIEKELSVKTFQLKENDVMIMGSDGRDDLLLRIDEQGRRVINDDESIFLKAVEEGEGRLEDIQNKLLVQGELTDDFTLLRIAYKEKRASKSAVVVNEKLANEAKKLILEGNEKEGLKLLTQAGIHEQSNEVFKELISALQKNGKLEHASSLVEKAVAFFPADLELIFLATLVYKQGKHFEKAADHGERFRLREPANVKNLVNLADIYRLIGNHKRAELFLAQASEIDSDYSELKKLEKLLLQK